MILVVSLSYLRSQRWIHLFYFLQFHLIEIQRPTNNLDDHTLIQMSCTMAEGIIGERIYLEHYERPE